MPPSTAAPAASSDDTTRTEAKAPAGPVLLENRRHGITIATHSRPDPNTQGGQVKWITEHKNLVPGLQFVDAEEWSRLRPSVEERIAKSEIVEHASFAKLSEPVIAEALRNSGDVACMRKLLEVEKRDKIAKLIEKAIAETLSGVATLRTRQAAHTPR